MGVGVEAPVGQDLAVVRLEKLAPGRTGLVALRRLAK